MYSLYIANKNYSSWSLRPWILMMQLGIPFEEKLIPFEENNWDTFRRFSPSGKVPCLIDQGNIVWDSLSIAEYLAEIHSNVWPKNKQQRSWARCAAAEMHSGFSHLREICGMNIGIRISLHEINQRLKSDLARINELWTEGLTRFGGPFLAGEEFSAVDAFFAPVIFRVQTFGLELNSKAFAYYQHMLGLQGMQQWQSMALAELFRDPIHDMEVEKYGVIDKDLRSI